MNKFIASGNLGKDSQTNTVGTIKVINFSIAVTNGYGDKKQTFWLECSKFGENTKVAEYLVKGTKVLVSGELSLRTWEKDGKQGTSICLRCDDIELLGGNKETAPAQVTQPTSQEKTTTSAITTHEDSPLPF
jgi:single-strand DNA-binding protein